MKNVICWWSGGITSAVACKIAIDTFGIDNCRIIFMDTKNEDDDTYRFKDDCEKLYKKKIESITVMDGKKYDSIEDIWEQYESLAHAKGAICSSVAKRDLRLDFQRKNKFDYQIFGFEFHKKEMKRALNLKTNYPTAKPLFPLLMFALSKNDCIRYFDKENIEPPASYKMGYNNNNCLKTGCVKGGVGYWQKYKKDFPKEFSEMVERERRYSLSKGEPVTICKDQSDIAKKNGLVRVFLEHNPNFPEYKDISMIKGHIPDFHFECNGMCGTQGNIFH